MASRLVRTAPTRDVTDPPPKSRPRVPAQTAANNFCPPPSDTSRVGSAWLTGQGGPPRPKGELQRIGGHAAKREHRAEGRGSPPPRPGQERAHSLARIADSARAGPTSKRPRTARGVRRCGRTSGTFGPSAAEIRPTRRFGRSQPNARRNKRSTSGEHSVSVWSKSGRVLPSSGQGRRHLVRAARPICFGQNPGDLGRPLPNLGQSVTHEGPVRKKGLASFAHVTLNAQSFESFADNTSSTSSVPTYAHLPLAFPWLRRRRAQSGTAQPSAVQSTACRGRTTSLLCGRGGTPYLFGRGPREVPSGTTPQGCKVSGKTRPVLCCVNLCVVANLRWPNLAE